MKTLYFDNNATTPVAPEVLLAIEPFWAEAFYNPSSAYQGARVPAAAIRTARRQVTSLIGAAEEREIVFTSGGTESNNLAIRAALAANPAKKHIVTTQVEHSSVLKLCRQLSSEGYRVSELAVDSNGNLNLSELEAALSSDTALVSIMMVNNETGVIFPIKEFSRIVKSRGILFHVDGVQAVGKLPVILSEAKDPISRSFGLRPQDDARKAQDDIVIDYFSLSAHKIYGPKGAGALFVRTGAPFQPLILGGSQERGRRAGTENVPGIVGLGAACALAEKNLDEEIVRLTQLRDNFERTVCEKIPGVTINGVDSFRASSSPHAFRRGSNSADSRLKPHCAPLREHSSRRTGRSSAKVCGNDEKEVVCGNDDVAASRICNTSNLQFAGVDSETLLMALDERGIYASSGSACMSGSQSPSHVLTAMGLSDAQAKSCVRFSFGRHTTAQDVEILIQALQEIIGRLRQIKSGSSYAHAH